MTTTARIIDEFSTVDERDWNRLDHRDNPFLSHGFLKALEESESVNQDGGWRPYHLSLYRGDRLVAFAPTYLKGHSHGEFVFDWSWADAHHRHGLPYYPKLLTAIPWTPVTGPRLLVDPDEPDAEELRIGLVKLAIAQCEELNLSSWHCNFTLESEQAALSLPELLERPDAQFHWFNESYASFDDFLGSLRSRKRKQVRRERRQVESAGVRFRWQSGDTLTPQERDFVFRCYLRTFQIYGNHAALNPQFFESICQDLGEGVQVVLGERSGELVAMAFYLTGGGRLYGRYWGCTEDLPGLHFETAYYQGIDWCIKNGINVFESGAQGEHKISRGFVPTATRSFHWITHPGFREAIADHLGKERGWKQDYHDDLSTRLPFRQTGP